MVSYCFFENPKNVPFLQILRFSGFLVNSPQLKPLYVPGMNLRTKIA
jgi:hypothetical protein